MKVRIANPATVSQRGGLAHGSIEQFSSLLRPSRFAGAFTLLEVIVACALFFMFAFAVLSLVTQGLVAARSLQQREPDPGIILAALSLTNAFEEGSMSGDYEDIAPGMYPGYRWEAAISEVGSNGLFLVDVMTYSQRKRANPVATSALFYRPQSKPGSATRGHP
jgi:hypothetical protein